MAFLKKMSRHYKIKSLQRQFDDKVAQVRQLMEDKQIEASGQVLLEAEKLRKEIEELTSEDNPPPEA